MALFGWGGKKQPVSSTPPKLSPEASLPTYSTENPITARPASSFAVSPTLEYKCASNEENENRKYLGVWTPNSNIYTGKPIQFYITQSPDTVSRITKLSRTPFLIWLAVSQPIFEKLNPDKKLPWNIHPRDDNLIYISIDNIGNLTTIKSVNEPYTFTGSDNNEYTLDGSWYVEECPQNGGYRRKSRRRRKGRKARKTRRSRK